MCGDFNLPHANWPEAQATSQASLEVKAMLNDLSMFTLEFYMTKTVNELTNKDGNVLELIFCNNSDLIHSYTCVPTFHSISHHHLITTATSLNLHKTGLTVERTFLNEFKKLNFFKETVDWESLTKLISDRDWKVMFQNLSPDEIIKNFINMVINICHKICS